MGRVCLSDATLINLTECIHGLKKSTGHALQNLQQSPDSLASVVPGNRLTLDYSLAEEGCVQYKQNLLH